MTDTIPLTDLDQQASPEESAEQLELASIHDFGAKLVQPGSREALEHYVRWQVAMRMRARPARSRSSFSASTCTRR